MASGRSIIVLLLLTFIPKSISESIIQIYPKIRTSIPPVPASSGDALYCDSWRFSVETNDAGTWSAIPKRCIGYVKEYMTGDRYRSDLEMVADNSAEFAKTVKMRGNGKDAWVFDIDETLLSNLPYYAVNGFGSDIFNEKSFDDWVALAEAPALPASLRLYTELQKMGVTIFVLTGREEFQRNTTEKNLQFAGYTHWDKLFLRGPSDKGKLATAYKSKRERN